MLSPIDQLGLIRSIAEAMSVGNEPEEVAQHVAEVVTQSVEADVCFVHMVDSERRRLTLIGATPPFDSLRGKIELAMGDGIAGDVARTGVAAAVANKWEDKRYRYIPELKGEDFASLVSVPMKRGSEVVGVINVHWAFPLKDFGPVTEVLGVVASLVASSMENSILLARLAKREAELSRFASLTIEAQESERRRIAADIHDGIGQGLLSLLFHLDAAEGASPDEPDVVVKEIAKAKELARLTLGEVRASIWKLRPGVLDDLGLSAALESIARSVHTVVVSVDCGSISISPHAETALFRICQEALANITKHSRATSAHVKLRETGGEVVLVVSDDGIGFDTDQEHGDDHYGLLGMRERAELVGGAFEIYSKIGEGTRLTVRLPRAV